MGCVESITAYKFPKQSEYVNRRCKVCFNYDTSVTLLGTVVRDDREKPFETLIKLDDGRILLAEECQYSYLSPITPTEVFGLRDESPTSSEA